jgi:fructose-1,6-bisphosphatase I
MSLEQFVLDEERQLPDNSGSFARLLRDISVAGKIVNLALMEAGLGDLMGASGVVNVQGEDQKQLDAIAHTEFVRALGRGGECRVVGSEEADAPISLFGEHVSGRFTVLMDPIDGSGNIDVTAPVGTIFSVFEDLEPGPTDRDRAVVQTGLKQVAAGYIVYGSSTMLVYSAGFGVNGFTLDPEIGEFILSHPRIRIPGAPSIYSVNCAQAAGWAPGLRRFVRWMQDESREGGPFTLRYAGSLVADFHRNMLRGGLCMYPATRIHRSGKLRLMYEANPMAFIAEQAGGAASDGRHRILTKQPTSLHERTPLFIGNRDLVAKVEEALAHEEPAHTART